MQVVWNVNRILARGESEKPNQSTVERKLKLTRNQRRAKFKQAVMLRRGSSTGFSGYGISLIWSSGFGIDGMLGRWDAKNPPRDYGIAGRFGSGLRDWRTLWGTLQEWQPAFSKSPLQIPIVSHIKTPSLFTQLLYSWILLDSLWYTKHSSGLSQPYLLQGHPTLFKISF